MAQTGDKALGFTLVEVLITLTILSMLMLAGTSVYNFMAQSWQRNTLLYERSEDQFSDWLRVTRALSATYPKLVRQNERLGFYFLGRENGFTGVTRQSLQDPLVPAVYRLFREALEGDMLLVYEEALLSNAILSSSEQQLPFMYRQVLVSTDDEIEFEYFGWENIGIRMQESGVEGVGAEPSWFLEYDGAERRQHPLVIQVRIGEFLWPITVADNTEQLLRRASEQGI